MKVRAVYLSDEEWTKLMSIAIDLNRKNIDVANPQGGLSKSAVVRWFIKSYELPAQAKGIK